MSVVSLVSGGLDSSLMALFAKEAGVIQHPLFVDYGQLSVAREWAACLLVHDRHELPVPTRIDLSGFGRTISSGLTDPTKHVNLDAFLPGRNLLLLLAGASFAYQVDASCILIGVLHQQGKLFPDQSQEFLESVESILPFAVQRTLTIQTPLMAFTKKDVTRMAEHAGLTDTYSCHSGKAIPCGKCVACLEYDFN